VLAVLLLVIKVLVCWCCPRHADRQCCVVLAMLLRMVMMLGCWCCTTRHADRGCCAGLAMLLLLLVMKVLWCAGATLVILIVSVASCWRCYC
jgi:hypothetical protein